MCHEYARSAWNRERDDSEAEAEEELPEFLNEEGNEDVEVLTDGGE